MVMLIQDPDPNLQHPLPLEENSVSYRVCREKGGNSSENGIFTYKTVPELADKIIKLLLDLEDTVGLQFEAKPSRSIESWLRACLKPAKIEVRQWPNNMLLLIKGYEYKK